MQLLAGRTMHGGLGAGRAERGGTSDIPGTPGPRPPERGGREGGREKRREGDRDSPLGVYNKKKRSTLTLA